MEFNMNNLKKTALLFLISLFFTMCMSKKIIINNNSVAYTKMNYDTDENNNLISIDILFDRIVSVKIGNNNFRLKNNTWHQLYPNGDASNIHIASDQYVFIGKRKLLIKATYYHSGHLCDLVLYESGNVKEVWLKENTYFKINEKDVLILGAIRKYPDVNKFVYLHSIEFHENGNVAHAALGEKFRFKGKVWPIGSWVTLGDKGSVLSVYEDDMYDMNIK